MSDGFDLAVQIVADAERIEREKQGLALTPDEAKKLRAADFLRKIAPYLFDSRGTGAPPRP